MESQRLSIKQAINEAIEIFKVQWKFLVVLALVILLGSLTLDVLGQTLEENTGVGFGFGLVRWIVEMYAGLVIINLSLKAVGGEKLNWKNLSSYLPTEVNLIKNYVLTSIVYAILVAIGMILLIIPGIIFAAMYSLAIYLVVDKKMGFKEALSESKRITNGNRMKLFVMGLLMALLNALGALFFGVGMLVTVPVSMLVGAIAYRTLADGKREKTPVENMSQKLVSSSVNDYQI